MKANGLSKSKGRKGYLILGVFSLFSFSLSVFAIVFSIKTAKSLPKSASQIFKESIASMVEVVSYDNPEVKEYGTATMIDDKGVYATNAHLVCHSSGGEKLMFEHVLIRSAFEENFHEVKITKCDVDMDVALIECDASDIGSKPIKISERKPSFGDTVYAIGNGLNHGIGISEGIISVPDVRFETGIVSRNVIQCDITVNGGNSGGALLDSEGALLGIVFFRVKSPDGNIAYGLAYAIPVELFSY